MLVRTAKTGQRQVSFIDDPTIVSLLIRHYGARQRAGDHALFRLSYAKLLTAMRTAGAHFGLDAALVTTHSCRHGGALTLFLRHVDTATIASRGRWSSVRTLERYLTNGRGALLDMRFTPAVTAKLNACVNLV